MCSRAYLMLDIIEDKVPYALQALQSALRVVAVDRLEGHPNVLVIIEAEDRQQMADAMIPVLDSVERTAKDVHILINQNSNIGARNIYNDNIRQEPLVPGIICRN